jgi:hypothetical protein
MPETTKNWKWEPAGSTACDRKSYRVLKVGKRGAKRLLRVCCPRGKFKRGKCRVSMKLVGIARPRRRQ